MIHFIIIVLSTEILYRNCHMGSSCGCNVSDVDVYGSCGPLHCPRHSSKDRCNKKLRDEYHFYLSFENSNCRDYITEKLFWNALL